MSKLVYCGPYYNGDAEQEIIRLSKGQLNNASNRFQSALLKGLMKIYGEEEIIVINALPIGTWPFHSTKFLLKDKNWQIGTCQAHEIGCVNLPVFKQIDREERLYRLLSRVVEDGDCVLLYSCYLPFLNAVCRIKKNIHFSIIVTDLPEYYDLGRTSCLRKIVREFNNKMIYRRLENVNSFVLLTEQMKEPLRVGNRPYTIVEGIWSKEGSKIESIPKNVEKRILFYSGTLHYQFGIQLLLDAFKQIEGENYELWICGAGEAAENIKKLAEKDSRIKFFGFCDSTRVAELRNCASVLVNPRPADGEYTKYSFPSKTMEYLASGIPVVMFHLPGIPKEYDELLFYVEKPEANEFRQRVIEICSLDDEERMQYSIRARRFIQEQKNETMQAAKILELIKNS